MTVSLPRYELKYWCDDLTWALLLEELRGLVVVDPHIAADHPWYTISSLYFDTDDLACYYAKVDGLSSRGKVRLRRYDRERSGFIELKGKKGRLVRKYRVALDPAGVVAIARCDLGPLHDAFRARDSAAARLLAEWNLRALQPSVITRYERSAYMLVEDPAVRITLDRSLACHSKEASEAFLREDVDTTPMKRIQLPNILEVKFTGALPPFLGKCLRRHGLKWRSISKYCYAVEGAGLRALPPAPAEDHQEASRV